MFQIQSRPDTYQTGTTLDDHQVVMGPFHSPWVVALFFDNGGNLQNVERRAVPTPSKADGPHDIPFQEVIETISALWKREIGFTEGPISVQLFFLQDYCIGIEEFPLDLKDYLSNSSQYSPEDQAEFIKDIDRWKADGNYVFFWSESYHLDKNGDSL
jgi:hypothetical protein